jgi:hypothetical protein
MIATVFAWFILLSYSSGIIEISGPRISRSPA